MDDWRRAEGDLSAPLARVAQRLGAFDDRTLRGPKGWQRRMALSEASDLD